MRVDAEDSKMPSYEIVAAKIAEIEDEMKRVDLWQSEPLQPEQYQFTRAFGGDTMSFEQWLQFIFIPRVKGIIESRDTFPTSSSVGTYAAREWGWSPLGIDTNRLGTLLSEFDALF